MLTGGWDRETIPGGWLRPGRNELVFSGAGSLVIGRRRARPQTASSASGAAASGRGDMLGAANDLTGEYVVRLRVRGHPQEGVATSPVLDLAAEPAVAPGMEVEALRLSAASETPPGTSVRFEVRSGSTALYAADHWTSWRPADSGESLPGARFVQWRAFLSSRDPAVTPLVKSVTIEASGRAVGANLRRIEVVEAPENDLAVSSYPFDYADPHHPRMRHLREKYRLEEVVAPGQTEMERFALLRQWVRRQWEGWNDNTYDYCPQWDALEILELAPQNLALGMCTHYAAVFSQSAAALGYHARAPDRRSPLPGRDLVRRARQVDPPGPGAPARPRGRLPVRGGRCPHQRPRDAPPRRRRPDGGPGVRAPTARSRRAAPDDVRPALPALRHPVAQRPPLPPRAAGAGAGDGPVPLGRPPVVGRTASTRGTPSTPSTRCRPTGPRTSTGT